jgi:hypothetical protein
LIWLIVIPIFQFLPERLLRNCFAHTMKAERQRMDPSFHWQDKQKGSKAMTERHRMDLHYVQKNNSRQRQNWCDITADK